MSNFGQAFRTVRLIRNLSLEQVAEVLEIDERSLRDIESGKTKVISDRFQQMTRLYEIGPEVVFDLASGKTSFQNFIHDAKPPITATQTRMPEKDLQEKYLASLEKRIEDLEACIRHLENNEHFLKGLIAQIRPE